MTYEPLNKKGLILSRELIIRLKLFESAKLGQLWPDLQKRNHAEIDRFGQKSNFFPYEFFSQIKT